MLYSLAMVRLSEGSREVARAHLEESLALARQTGMGFFGPCILSGIAATVDIHAQSRKALDEGEALLRTPCISHCHLFFYRNAIDLNLRWHDWDEALRYAAALENYVRGEPLPWATLMIERANFSVSMSNLVCLLTAPTKLRRGLRKAIGVVNTVTDHAPIRHLDS